MPVFSPWFWLPWHMLQAYPLTRNLPFADLMIPLIHMIYVPYYLQEHWTGDEPLVPMIEPYNGAIKGFLTVLVLAFWWFTHQKSDHKTVVKIAITLWAIFLFVQKPLGWHGFPSPEVQQRIDDNEDPSYNNWHLFLHAYLLVLFWVPAMTVPSHKNGKGGAPYEAIGP